MCCVLNNEIVKAYMQRKMKYEQGLILDDGEDFAIFGGSSLLMCAYSETKI